MADSHRGEPLRSPAAPPSAPRRRSSRDAVFPATRLAAVLGAAARAEVVLVGDDHALPRAQANLLRLARSLHARGRLAGIALEAFSTVHQDLLDAFVGGDLDELGLLRRSGLRRRWPFDLRGLRRVLRFGRRAGVSLLALDPPDGIARTRARRERFVATRLASAGSDPGRGAVLALFGSEHLSSLRRGLRRAIRRAGGRGRVVAIDQNPGWIDRAGLAGRVVRTGPGRFALLDTVPALARRSFLDQTSPPWTAADLVAEAARRLARRFGLPFEGLDRLEILGPEGRDAWEARDRGRRGESGGFASGGRDRLVRVDDARGALLLTAREPHFVAEAAAHALRLEGNAKSPPTRSAVESFARDAMAAAWAFFASRLVNPRREPLSVSERLANSPCGCGPTERRLALSVRAAQRDWLLDPGRETRRRFGRALRSAPPSLRSLCAWSFGEIVGLSLHRRFREGKLPPASLRRWPRCAVAAAPRLLRFLGRA